MYHYTSFDIFLKIWADKTLKFSSLSGLNDINEVSKFYFGKHNPRGFTDTEALSEEVKSYKQISLMEETKNMYYSCLLPVMWGHYGDKGRGICIRIDISKIKFSNKVFRGKVRYVKEIKPVTYDNSDIINFIIKHKKILFFTKTKDWSYEKEYRIVSKDEEFLDISNAISEIIITSLFGMTNNYKDNGGIRSTLFNQVLKPMLPDNVKILEFCPNGLNGISLVDEKNNQIYPHNININNIDFSK